MSLCSWIWSVMECCSPVGPLKFGANHIQTLVLKLSKYSQSICITNQYLWQFILLIYYESCWHHRFNSLGLKLKIFMTYYSANYFHYWFILDNVNVFFCLFVCFFKNILSLPGHKVTASNCFSCPTNKLKPKDSSFMMKDKDNLDT